MKMSRRTKSEWLRSTWS